MQFRVPQFIDIEDKIFGPFTLKQFIYLAGGAGMCFVMYKVLPIYISIFLIIPIGGFAAALAFYKINNKPFIEIVQAFITYKFQSKLYIWKKDFKPKEPEKKEIPKKATYSALPKLSNSKLKDISWSLDVLDNKKKK